MKVSPLTAQAYEFACHSAACRPPTSGGTGGSSGKGGGGSSAVTNRRLKPGQRVSVKGSSGKSVGSVFRDSKGGYHWESKIAGAFGARGQAKSFAEAARKVQGMETHTKRVSDLDAKLRARYAAKNR